MTNYAHLAPQARAIVELPADERIAWCRSQSIWIKTAEASQILDDIGELLETQNQTTYQCRALLGAGGIGKTTLLRKACERYNTPDRQALLYIDLSSYGKFVDLQQIFVSNLGITDSAKKLFTTMDGPKIVSERLRDLGVKITIFDEANALASATRYKNDNRNWLRGLPNSLYSQSVILGGTPDIKGFIFGDDHLCQRFGEWDLRSWEPKTVSFSKFIISFVRFLPLRECSFVDNESFMMKLYTYAGGTTRIIVRYLVDSAIFAILTNEERITIDVLKASYEANIVIYAASGMTI
ncbi:TniB family NTP-binding protein [Pseudomonas fluorescens]|uniref:TniB family NTP-binding protein n=1 Tax=Pseudomonas fluorescens TaxID=294 RepID=UPI003813347C